ncbi:methyltransferase domain-containing protein [Cellulomonas sp. S1-8]|uniref:methyltransferase domain-containing protein n=1 Tax=Cellulomonas sp. S1-8 TaxID=2904790 RepID=UPI002243F07F|nr:methyltransferase domain-containing protein [Cellulomonas sp. S1-8]UZN03777.1 methyltransferase domain-containing protein [Cellulomonas sp. S1-8]
MPAPTPTTATPRPLEVTDLLVRVEDGRRVPVRRTDVVDELRSRGQARAARLAARLPVRADDVLDERAVDALLVRIHCELQRLEEELQQPRRIAELLLPWVVRWRAQDPRRPVRVVDVGCGIGYVVRWLAHSGVLGPDVELVGADLNPVLVEAARRLARADRAACRFVAGDAFAPGGVVDDPERTVVLSVGLLHHLAPEDLPAFFAAQATLGVAVFTHLDPDPDPWSTAAAWMFHRARMREPVSRHDGVMSFRRAHPGPVLLDAARQGAPGYDVTVTDGRRLRPRIHAALRPVTGVRRGL